MQVASSSVAVVVNWNVRVAPETRTCARRLGCCAPPCALLNPQTSRPLPGPQHVFGLLYQIGCPGIYTFIQLLSRGYRGPSSGLYGGHLEKLKTASVTHYTSMSMCMYICCVCVLIWGHPTM